MKRTGARESATATLDGETIQEAVATPQGANGGVTEASQRWETFTRVAPLELAEEGDGRTLYGRVVPYNVIADVADPPTYTPYRESFAPGAFRAQLQAANRIDVLLNYQHRQGISDVIGRGVSLEDQDDGLYGHFRILDHSDGDKALELIHTGVLRGLSTEFSVRKTRTVEGVQERVDARIANVALCREYQANTGGPKAAYPGAEVLSIRTEDPGAAGSPPTVPMMPSDTIERLAALGITPIIVRAVTRKPWDDSPTRFTDEEYQRSCLICRGTDAPPKTDCSLPVLEPNGDVNANALAAAFAALRGGRGGVANVPGQMRTAAARKLIRLYRQAGMEPPPAMTTMAGM